MKWVAAGLALLHVGCAIDRGNGFSSLEAASLEVSLVPEAISDGAGGEGGESGESGATQLVTDRGYEIVVERALMRVDRMELQEPTGDSNSEPVETDGGHDHDHEQSAHSAAEDEAFETLVTLGFREPISMTAPAAAPADSYEPSRELARSSPRRVLVVLEHLEIDGTVSGGDFADDSASLIVDLPLDIELGASLEPIEIDRDAPKSVRLSTTVTAPASLFDGIDFAALSARDSVVIDESDAAVAEAIAASLAASDTHASLE